MAPRAKKPTPKNPIDSVVDIPRDEISNKLTTFLQNFKNTGVLSLPLREKKTSIYRPPPHHRYAHNYGTIHQIYSEHKLVLFEITSGLLISNLNEPDHMFITMWALFYNVKAVFLGKNRNSWVGLKETIVIDFCDDLCCFFGCSRKSLGLSGSGQFRGFVAGSIIITEKTTIAPYREELNCTGRRMQFLGLTYTDITSSGITNDYFTPMSEVDRKCALGIQDEEWISNEKQVTENIGHHLEMGLKVDIEVISLRSRTYLSNELLPAKLLRMGVEGLNINS